jgi:co-chaperonin GroES (HSP10)
MSEKKTLKINKYDALMEQCIPQHGWLLVATERGEEQTAGGLYVGSQVADMVTRVVAVGPGVTKTDAKPGDFIIYKDGVQGVPKAYQRLVSRDYAFVYELNVLGKVSPEVSVTLPRITD